VTHQSHSCVSSGISDAARGEEADALAQWLYHVMLTQVVLACQIHIRLIISIFSNAGGTMIKQRELCDYSFR
jgi:hypothetical protein